MREYLFFCRKKFLAKCKHCNLKSCVTELISGVRETYLKIDWKK